jgi:DNA-binding NarL/FixJ family response regulator
MTQQELIALRSFILNAIKDEDTTQELLFEIVRQNLSFPLAVNYVKLCLRGSAYRLNAKHNGKRKKDALNHSRISLNEETQNAQDCTILEIIENTTAINPQSVIELSEFIEMLTDEEKMILNLINDGFTIREICKHLKISSKTVSKILKSIRVKASTYFFE